MTTASISIAKTPADDFVTAWLTTSGIDLLMKRAGEEFRVRGIAYGSLTGELKSAADKTVPVTVSFTNSDSAIIVAIDGVEIQLREQPKGHFFGWLKPMERAEPISLANARRLAGVAMQAQNAGKAAAKAAAGIEDDLPF